MRAGHVWGLDTSAEKLDFVEPRFALVFRESFVCAHTQKILFRTELSNVPGNSFSYNLDATLSASTKAEVYFTNEAG
jgi:hypothetical protein